MPSRPFAAVLVLIFPFTQCLFAQKIASVFPLGAERGSSVTVEVRGQDFEGAYAVWFGKGIKGEIRNVECIEAPAVQADDGQKQQQKWFRAIIDVKVD